MILYVNGDSHSAGAEAVNSYCFAEDDAQLRLSGRKPHPDNLAVSYGQRLADTLGYELVCQAESASSNDRILRTTIDYLNSNPKPSLVVIGWSTWERKEYIHNGIAYQLSGGSAGWDWPDAVKDYHRSWVLTTPDAQRTQYWHDTIWDLHEYFNQNQITHLFFNTYTAFEHQLIQKDWGGNYIDPYNLDAVYYNWLKDNGYQTVSPNSYHFGADAHSAWANHLTKWIKESIITK